MGSMKPGMGFDGERLLSLSYGRKCSGMVAQLWGRDLVCSCWACVRSACWPGKSWFAAVCNEECGMWREEACPGGLGFLQLVAWSW